MTNPLSDLKSTVRGFRVSELRHILANARDVFVNAVDSFMRNGDANQAAAIAFYAVLSAIPLLILTVIVISLFFGSHQGAHGELTRIIKDFHPYISEKFLMETGVIEEKLRVLGWIGLVSLVWFSSLIFNSIETAFSLIFRSSDCRSYLRSKLLGISMIPLGWAVGMTSVLLTYFTRLIRDNPYIAVGGWMADMLVHGFMFTYVIPYVVLVIFATIVYKIIPTEKISFWNALAASALFSALMEIAKHIFTWYLANYSRYDVIYGPLETMVIIVIWVFYVSWILLFCAELVSSYRNRTLLLLEKAITGMANGDSDSRLNARLFRKFGRFYAKGEYVCTEGEEGREMFYILSGRVQVEKKAGKTNKLITEMGPGNYFGEMAALIQSPRTASVRTLTDCDIAVIDAGTFRELIKQYGNIAVLVLKEMSMRVKNATTKIENLAHEWIKLVTVLYFLKEWPFADGLDYESELAGMSGKETWEVREVINELAKAGVFEQEGNIVRGFRKERIWGILGSTEAKLQEAS
jgi:membrane protein